MIDKTLPAYWLGGRVGFGGVIFGVVIKTSSVVVLDGGRKVLVEVVIGGGVIVVVVVVVVGVGGKYSLFGTQNFSTGIGWKYCASAQTNKTTKNAED